MNAVVLPPSLATWCEELGRSLREGSQLVIVEAAEGGGLTSALHAVAGRMTALGDADRAAVHTLVGVPWERDVPGALVAQVTSAPVTADDPHATAARLLDELGEEASDGTAPSGWIVVVDNAQHADAASLEILASMTRRRGPRRVLVILGFTQGAVPAPILAAADVATHLPRVRADDVEAMAGRLGIAVPAPKTADVARATGGSLRLVDDLLRHVPPQEWEVTTLDVPPAPSLVRRVQAARETLAGPSRALLEAAAVLADPITGSVPATSERVAELAGVPPDAELLDDLSNRGLLEVADAAARRLRFSPPLMAAAVVATLPVVERRDLHARAVAYVDSDVAVARHRWLARPRADGALARDLAAQADAHAAGGCWASAGRLWLVASQAAGEPDERARLLVAGVDALIEGGAVVEAQRHLTRVETQPESAERDGLLGYLAVVRGRPFEAEARLRRALEILPAVGAERTAARLYQRMVLHNLASGRPADLVTFADRAVALGPEHPEAVGASAIRGLGAALDDGVGPTLSDYERRLATMEAGPTRQRMLMASGWLRLVGDDPDTARSELEQATSIAGGEGSSRISAWSAAWLARAQFATGDWDSALKTATVGAERARASGLLLLVPLLEWTVVQVHALAGDHDEARAALRRSRVPFDSYPVMRVPAALAQASLLEAQGDYSGVIRALAPLTQPWADAWVSEPGFWPWADVYANALIVVGRHDDADRFLRPHETRAGGHRSATARLRYARGRLSAAQGDIEAARRQFDEALDLLVPLPLPYDAARVRFAYGQALRRAGKRAEADAVFLAAKDAYDALGATTYARRCRDEIAASGARISGGPRGSRPTARGATPTAQERAIATLVARGASNKEVATALFISVKTVQHHLTSLYRKLGISSRTELASQWADQNGDDTGL